jgi:hypothetical protein
MSWEGGVVEAQPPPNRAGLVIKHGDGRIVTACVAFDEAQLSGLQLLQRAGLDLSIEASSTGGAICRINGEGCSFPQQSCFCQCEGAACTYWSYWRGGGSGWQYSNLGAGNTAVVPGSVEGWVWGPGTVESAGQPPALSFAEVCADATATPSPSPTATGTPAPTALATNTATQTPVPTSTLPPVQADAPAGGPPRIEWFGADRTALVRGESATLRWKVTNAASVLLRAGGEAVAVDAEGSTVFAPPVGVEVRLEASNSSGTVSSSVVLVVAEPTVAVVAAAVPPTPLAATPLPPTPLPPTPLPPTPVSPTATYTPPAESLAVAAEPTVRLLLPLVMRNEGQVAVVAVAPTAVQAAVAAAVPTTAVAAAEPSLAAIALPTVGAVATEAPPSMPTGERGMAGQEISLLWLALAALVLLPAGVGIVGYGVWRVMRGT